MKRDEWAMEKGGRGDRRDLIWGERKERGACMYAWMGGVNGVE